MVPLQRDAYVTWQGKTYAIPWWSETRVLFYHKDLLDKAGVKPPTTWAEWVEAAKKLTSGEQYGFAFTTDGTFPGQLWVPLGISNGGRIIDKSGMVVVGHRADARGPHVRHRLLHEAQDDAAGHADLQAARTSTSYSSSRRSP